MDEVVITVGDAEGESEQASEVIHNEGVHCCEHCVQHAERIVRLEELITTLQGEVFQARGAAEQAMEQSEEATQVAEAAGVIAVEAAIAQESEPEEVLDDESEFGGVGGPEQGIGEPVGEAGTETEPITIQVEPEKEPEAKQPGYGFRRGKRR